MDCSLAHPIADLCPPSSQVAVNTGSAREVPGLTGCMAPAMDKVTGTIGAVPERGDSGLRAYLTALSPSAVFAGLLSAFAGFASSFAIVVQGLDTAGATPQQAAAGLMAAAVAMGLGGVFLSLRARQPISVAWSTAGAAFLAGGTIPEGGFPVVVGAFVMAALLIILAGLWRPFGRAVSAIPASLGSAMLAGVLLPLCLAPFEAIAHYPAIGLPIVLTWLVVGLFFRLLAVPAAVLVAAVLIGIHFHDSIGAADLAWTMPEPVMPVFTAAGFTGLAIPLFLITMASQNIPGMAVLANFGYRPDASRMFGWTGLFGLIGAPFGSVTINLAAITAAICAGEEAHPDPSRRYWSAVVAGLFYVILGLGAGLAVGFMSIAPPVLIAAVAGLALLGALAGAMNSAMQSPGERDSAVITFLMTASGVTFFGIGGAFWGLLAGGAVFWLKKNLTKP